MAGCIVSQAMFQSCIGGNTKAKKWPVSKGQVSTCRRAARAGRDIVEHYEQLGRLKNAVACLPLRKLRQTVVLHYMQHLTIAEAAEAAGVREGTFKSRLNRALETLRKQVL